MSFRELVLCAVASIALIACGGPEEPDASQAGPSETQDPAAAAYPDSEGGCSAHSECSIDAYCAFSHATCGSQGPGLCVAMPDALSCASDAGAALCGCDGFTYESGCAAAAAGASIASEGPCPTEPAPTEPSLGTCGNVTCGAGEFCDFGDGSCGASPAEGTCRAVDAVCTSTEESTCGCDGTTYNSRCATQRAGVSVHHVGGC